MKRVIRFNSDINVVFPLFNAPLQFLSQPDQGVIPPLSADGDGGSGDASSSGGGGGAGGRSSGRSHAQPHVKAFQSLYSLLGYNELERRFTTMPHKVNLHF